jgi:hypothetical protein
MNPTNPTVDSTNKLNHFTSYGNVLKKQKNIIVIIVLVVNILFLTYSCNKIENQAPYLSGTWRVTSATIDGVKKNINEEWYLRAYDDDYRRGDFDIYFDFNGYFGGFFTEADVYHDYETIGDRYHIYGNYEVLWGRLDKYHPYHMYIHMRAYKSWHDHDPFGDWYSYYVDYEIEVKHFSKHKMKCEGTIKYNDYPRYESVKVQLTLSK